VQLDIFMILADGAYDDKRLFQAANETGVHLATEVNPRRAKSVENITSKTHNYLDKSGIDGMSCGCFLLTFVIGW
jgi:hypothetical protein